MGQGRTSVRYSDHILQRLPCFHSAQRVSIEVGQVSIWLQTVLWELNSITDIFGHFVQEVFCLTERSGVE